MMNKTNTFKSYLFPMVLISSILIGGITGYFFKESSPYLKPLGDIFLNLIFTTMVPLIFFSISSAIARTNARNQLGRIFSSMATIFIITSLVAACLAIVVVMMFPPAQGIDLTIPMTTIPIPGGFLNQLAGLFTVPNFSKLLSHEHMLALIVFSMLVGVAASREPKCVVFLQVGEQVFMRVFELIMLYAPIGFFAYFAVLVNELGPTLISSYARVAGIYYLLALFYFVIVYTLYAYIAGKKTGVNLFWNNVFLPAATSIATCSSAASIPANLVATRAMRVSPEIYETAIPLGSMIHKDGSVIGGVIKIAFLFGVFHLPFSGASVVLTALGVSLLVGTVMGAIPSGGMLGELLILSVYGFPSSALMVIAAISIIIDPIATLLNVTGNSVSSMLIARCVHGKKWYADMPSLPGK